MALKKIAPSKPFKTIFLFFICILFASLHQNCASFSVLPENIESPSLIEGTYLNNTVLNPFGDTTLWSVLDREKKSYTDSSIVLLKFNKNGVLFAQLVDNKKVAAQIKIKGKLKKDSCYYPKRRCFIVPILPILWYFSDDRTRIYSLKKSIVIERAGSGGGVFLVMAGGSEYNDAWEYKRIETPKAH